MMTMTMRSSTRNSMSHNESSSYKTKSTRWSVVMIRRRNYRNRKPSAVGIIFPLVLLLLFLLSSSSPSVSVTVPGVSSFQQLDAIKPHYRHQTVLIPPTSSSFNQNGLLLASSSIPTTVSTLSVAVLKRQERRRG